MPSTLAIIRNLFTDAADWAKAVAVWSAVLAGGVGLGPVVAGVLLEHFWWGSVFLINVPFMLLLLVIGPCCRSPAARQPGSTCSALFSLAAILPTIHALKEFAADGWTPILLAYLAVGAAAAVVFLWRRVVRSPMVDLSFQVRASAARSRSR